MKYLFSIIILIFLVTVNVPRLLTAHNAPCIYEVCPDAGGGEGLFVYVVDTTPPNFYEPAGTFCGIACFEREAHINWSLFSFDSIVWLIATLIIFVVARKRGATEI